MSMSEAGSPYFRSDNPTPSAPHAGAHLTSAGLYRTFPITADSPHEPWCYHFEWGACNCGPGKGEVFVGTGTVQPPPPRPWWRRKWWRR